MKQGYLFLILFFSIISCDEQEIIENSSSFYSNTAAYYPDGTLKRFIELDKNGNENGVYKFYYPSGTLEDSAILTNGNFHGNRFLFYPDGKLYKVTNYINNKFRSGITNDSLGVLKYYRAYDHLENLMFIIEYEKTGKIKRIDGNFMYGCILEDTIKEFQNFELLVGTPPKSAVKIQVFESFDGYKLKKEKYLVRPDHFNRVIYKIRRYPKKEVKYINIATIYDSISNKNYYDTCIVTINQSGKTSFTR